MDLRQMRGKEIVKTLGKYIKKNDDGWLVPSQTSRDMYQVDELLTCSCPDSQKRGVTCKHGYALRFYLQTEKPNGHVVEKTRLTYKQAWKAYDAAQTSEIRLFDVLLSDLVQSIEEPSYGFGRPRLSRKDTLFCCIQKAFSQLSARRAVSLFGNAMEKHQISKTPHYNSVNNYLRDASLTPSLYELVTVSAWPLRGVETDFAVDSTGFRTTCFGEYSEDKYELKREKKWLKAHACIGTKTNVFVSVQITDEHGGDSPQFISLVEKTVEGGFQVKEVSADKAYLSADNLNAVDALGGQAFIPFKENTTANMHGAKYRLFKKLFHNFQLHADEFYAHYHKRSNIEATFAAIKRKFGDTLKAKTTTAQMNELLCKIIAYNLTVLIHEIHELGVKPDFDVKNGNDQLSQPKNDQNDG